MTDSVASAATTLVFVVATILGGTAHSQPTAEFPGADWSEASPESQGVDSAKLKAAVAYMEANFGYTAHGHSANFCFVIPEWNMVVVRMGTTSIASGVPGILVIEAKWDMFFAKVADTLGVASQAGKPVLKTK